MRSSFIDKLVNKRWDILVLAHFFFPGVRPRVRAKLVSATRQNQVAAATAPQNSARPAFPSSDTVL